MTPVRTYITLESGEKEMEFIWHRSLSADEVPAFYDEAQKLLHHRMPGAPLVVLLEGDQLADALATLRSKGEKALL